MLRASNPSGSSSLKTYDMNKEIQKESVLPNSKMPVLKGAKNDKGKAIRPIVGPQYDPQGEIAKFGLQATEIVEYKDPISGDTKKIMIDRRGTTDEKLALTLLDDKISRDQKDSIISLYLFEKGKHGASMLMDLWQYKGTHTKESRAFQSTMRFDFELFLGVFQDFMAKSSALVFNNLPIELAEVEVEEDGKKITKEIVKVTRDVTPNEIAVVLGQFAQFHQIHGDLLARKIRQEVEKRERAKGKGIYLSTDGKPYSITEDGDIVEVVKRDVEEAAKEKESHE